MPEEPQDVLTNSLLKLEEELTSFGTIQNALVNARKDLQKAEQEWERLTKEQQQSALTLVSATKSAIETTNLVVDQTKTLAASLIPLAKAIETVNFPLRLDKIDMGLSTQVSTLTSLQGKIEREFNEAKDEFHASKKRDWIIIGLIAVNTMVVTALTVFTFLH